MNYSKSLVASAIFSVLSATGGAFADEVTAQTVVATVNGTEITLGHVIAARTNLPPQYQELPDETLFNGILDQVVQQELLKQSAGDLSKSVALQIENEERAIISGAEVQNISATAVTDESLQAAYDAKFSAFEPSREFNAAHILVETEEEAKALVEALEGGADFAALAREKSTGPSGPNGGDLGWFGLGMMVAPFEAAVVAMEEGEISAPVQTQFGWHVIKLAETRLQDIPSLAEVRDELSADIEEAAIRGRLAELESAATVERAEGVDPALIRKTELLNE